MDKKNFKTCQIKNNGKAVNVTLNRLFSFL